MAEFLAGIRAVVLEEADVLDARVALEVENALGGEAQELPDLVVAGIPELAVVPGIFDQHFMSAHRTHAVVNAVAAAAGLAFNVVKRRGMHHRARRPARALGIAAMTCVGSGESGQKRQTVSGRGDPPPGSSPVMTQDRVMGSLRSSMY